MLQKPLSCVGCSLYDIDKMGFSRPEGKCNNGVLVVGEALGTNEKLDGLPFRPWAEAGSALQTAFRMLGYDRNNFGLWNIIGCCPPYNALENTSYEYEAINHCKVHFQQVLDKYKPKVILALGNVPLKHLWKMPQEVEDYIESLQEDTKEEKAIKKKYLKNFKIGSMRGYVLESIYGIPMISSFHPSYITRDKGRTQLGTLMRDIKAAVDLAMGAIQPFRCNYDENPTIEQIKDFYEYCRNNPNLVISYDIETPMMARETDESEVEYENVEVRDIDSIQFSVKEGTGIFIKWYGDDNIEYVRKILALPNPKVGWNNTKFDTVNIEYHLGIGAINGTIFDAMDEWKWLNQDFVKTGRALQFATVFAAPNFPAWKFMAQIHPELYGCHDPNATLITHNFLVKSFTNSAFRFRSPITGQLITDTTKTVMQGYLDDIVKLRPILEDISRRGFPIDVKEREIFRNKIEKERERVLDELQDLYPMQLRRTSPLEGYKFVPKEVHELTADFKSRLDFNSSNGKGFIVVDSEDTFNFILSKYIEAKTRPEADETTGLVVKEFDFDGYKEKRYCRIEKFKPGSSKQVLDYIKFKKYKVPKTRDRLKGERETTAKDQLQPLWEETGDDLLYKCIYNRELDHLLNTYIGTGKKEGWKLGSDNRVHAQFLYIPSTGQLSTSPNIQNLPKRGTRYSSKGYGELAKQIRRMVAAKQGHLLISADWKAFHNNTLAFEAEDSDYMRISRIDPHSFLAAEITLDKLQSGAFAKLKQKKPIDIEYTIWLARIKKQEEALDRLKNFDKWLLLSDEELAKHLSWFKKNYSMTRDSQAKPALHGMGFGMQAGKFYKMNRHTFKSKAQPEKILELMRKRFPKVFIDYHEKIKELADRQTYLISRYGYVRRFFNVYDWRLLKTARAPKGDEKLIKTKAGYWLRKSGDSANEAIAYLPSNDAFGKKKEAIRDFAYPEKDGIIQKIGDHEFGYIDEFGCVNDLHDDLTWETEESKVEEACEIIREVMQRPARYLVNSLAPLGLSTAVEIKVGKNWDDFNDDLSKGSINLGGMKEIKL